MMTRIVSSIVLILLTLPAISPRDVAAGPVSTKAFAESEDSAQKSVLFSDGFESTGDLSLWSGDSLLSIIEGAGYEESLGAHGVSEGSPAFAETRLQRPSNEVYYRIRFKLTAQGDNAVSLLRFRTVTGRPILTLFVDPTGHIGYNADEIGTVVESSQEISLGTWYEIQARILIRGNYSRAEVWINDSAVEDLSKTLGLGNNKAGRIELGDNSAGRSFDITFDDVIVDSIRIESWREPSPVSGTLVVRALPAFAGLSFVLDGETFVTNEVGVARIEVDRWSTDLRQRIQVPNTALSDPSSAVTATFWGWDSWIGARDFDVNAFFDLSYPVSLAFEDLNGVPVDPTRISSITLQSSVGRSFTFTSEQIAEPQLIPGSRVVPSQQGRMSENFNYSVQDVTIRGSSVVNRGQQRFTAGIDSQWTVSLLLYSATISAQDALFGTSTGEAVKLEYPDGGSEQVAFGPDRSVTITSLPRGEYQVSVVGKGYSPPRPLTLSSDQTVELEVVTPLDIQVIAGLVLSFALGLLVAGRPRILTFPLRVYRRRRPDDIRPEGQS